MNDMAQQLANVSRQLAMAANLIAHLSDVVREPELDRRRERALLVEKRAVDLRDAIDRNLHNYEEKAR